MLAELVDFLVWIVRVALVVGLCWGAWLAFGAEFKPANAAKSFQLERFATLALLVLLLGTIGGLVYAV